jgi:SAM-dependent methyltransferase
MLETSTAPITRPNLINRIRSRQAGHPSGLLGRVIGRLMVKDTAGSNDRALELLEVREPRTVLEVGFGQGRTAAKLSDQGHRVVGVEVSETMLAQATARNRAACRDGRVQLHLGDGRSLPLEDDVADVAFTAHTIYFMDDPQETQNEIARVLKPGGRFVLACRVSDDRIPEWMDRDIYRLPSIDQVQTMLDAAGFTDIAHHRGDESTHMTNWFVAELPR